MNINDKYKIYIYERYVDLKKSKQEFDNNDLWKIFEYFSCIKLSNEYNKEFYEYDDIDPTFKEINKMTRNDTGIDCCDLNNTIVQCKLRKNTLNWSDCATFFGSQNIFSSELNKPIIRWYPLIITRNSESTLSDNLLARKDLFIDKTYDRQEIINYCENLITNPPEYPIADTSFSLRDYQTESINLINTSNNVIINLPTGTGKNVVIIYSMKDNLKYLILVPRIILMYQLKEEIIKHKPKYKSKIQLIGDSNNEFNETKNITICVYNSINIIEKYFNTFNKIFIDEAHHIEKPEIYYENDEETEDEVINVNSYVSIIKSLTSYNNNIYLSATIDEIEKFNYYRKDIREMIDLGYLCDYTIHVPIFTDDPTNRNICEYLIKTYRNIIIYCNSQKEGKILNKLMNEIQNYSSEYIDCLTSKRKRDDIVSRYKEGKIAFLINVRILVEGFDAPITKGICFMHLPSSKTTLIQIIGRALRLHSLKTIANIILPFSDIEDESSINNFLRVMASNDSRIRKSYENKKLGGYISLDSQIVNQDNEEEMNNIELKFEIIFNSFGIITNGSEIWDIRLEESKNYINKYRKLPPCDNRYRMKGQRIKDESINTSLGNWIIKQKQNYKNKEQIMKNESIYNSWEEFINHEKYKEYFLSNEELFHNSLEEVKKYIDKYEKRPSSKSNNKDIKTLGIFILNQNKREQNIKNDAIYNSWKQFINDEKYKKYLLSEVEIWNNNLNNIKNYIDNNNCLPSRNININDKNINSMGAWIKTQKGKYKKKIEIMKNEDIYNSWKQFTNDNKYKKYFLSNEKIEINL